MTLYTRTGDEGFTRRATGQRVRKCDAVVEACGAVDEVNSLLGWCLAATGEVDGEIRRMLQPIQPELLTAGAMISAAGPGDSPSVCLDAVAVGRVETQIDDICMRLPELKHFVLPAGCELACRLHVACAACRAAERRLAAALECETRIDPLLMQYLNRLSDLLFALARLANHLNGQAETVWEH